MILFRCVTPKYNTDIYTREVFTAIFIILKLAIKHALQKHNSNRSQRYNKSRAVLVIIKHQHNYV